MDLITVSFHFYTVNQFIMKKYFLLSTISILIPFLLCAQAPGRQNQPRYTVPKTQTAQPQNPKFTALTFAQMLDDTSWKGVRTWQTTNGMTVDSVTSLSFFLQYKQVSWTKQGWESVAPKPGTYNVSNYKIIIEFNYPPYKHYMEGTYDPVTKQITGTFKEERAVAQNAPSAYQAGTTTGVFVFVQK